MSRRSAGWAVATIVAAVGLFACNPGVQNAAGQTTAAPPVQAWTVTASPVPAAPSAVPSTTAPAATVVPTPTLTPGPTGSATHAYTFEPTPTVSTAPAPTSAPAPRVPAAAKERPSRGGVELPPTAQGALTGRKVVVDPGHNGVYAARINNRQVPDGTGGRKACNTSGTANSAFSEHELNWDVASLLADDLRARGATVWMTRPDDRGVGPCVDERAAIGNRVGADAVVWIHADGNDSASARGFHVITSETMKGGAETEARSRDLAVLVRDRMLTTGMPISTSWAATGSTSGTTLPASTCRSLPRSCSRWATCSRPRTLRSSRRSPFAPTSPLHSPTRSLPQ